MPVYNRSIAALMIGAILTVSAPAEALQCVPFAREVSGISIRGDAWTWWGAAAGQYDRGHAPRIGAVVVFKKFAAMRYGHVAVVTRVINSREVLVDHANWAPHRGRGRGQISKMVAVTDVSPGNDWTEVRVWNAPTRDFGTRTYPTYGFIYPISSRTYARQAVAMLAQDLGAAALHRMSAPGESVLATADQQIAAVMAEGHRSSSANDVFPLAPDADKATEPQAATADPAEPKAVQETDAKDGETAKTDQGKAEAGELPPASLVTAASTVNPSRKAMPPPCAGKLGADVNFMAGVDVQRPKAIFANKPQKCKHTLTGSLSGHSLNC